MKRNYQINPLKKIIINTPTGYTFEKPYKEDLEELYIKNNMSQPDLCQYFNVTKRILQGWIKLYNLKKDKSQRLKNSCLSISKISNDKRKTAFLKQQKTKLENYGNKNYNNRIKAKDTCLKKYGVDNPNRINIPLESIQIIENKDSLINYIQNNNILNATDLANKLNMSEPQIARYIVKYDLKYLFNYSKSLLEQDIKNIIMKHHLTENNIKIPNTNLEIDIYIPAKKIGIEFNGNFWHGELHRPRLYHQQKSMLAEENGIFLYHIFEYEWNAKREQIMNQINNLLGINKVKIGARKCAIRKVDTKEKKQFLEENHLQGDDRSSIKLGLYYNDELVSIMTFCKPRFNKNYQWELSRFCSKAGCNVIGGASKLFKYFVEKYSPQSVISYSNIAHTRGKLYETLGFAENAISTPDYIWYKSSKILTRYQCQKHKLVNQGYKGNSEADIMHNLGYYRIYDCGNKVWVWNNNYNKE